MRMRSMRAAGRWGTFVPQNERCSFFTELPHLPTPRGAGPFLPQGGGEEHSSPAALFVFLLRAAGTGIVAADFVAFAGDGFLPGIELAGRKYPVAVDTAEIGKLVPGLDLS